TDGRSVPAAVGSAGPWSLPGLAGAALGTLAILAVVGAGWAVGLLGPWLRFPEIAAMAPAVGAAALVMGGVLLDLAGLSLAGWQAYAVLALVAPGGWALAARVLKRSRRAGSVALQRTPWRGRPDRTRSSGSGPGSVIARPGASRWPPLTVALTCLQSAIQVARRQGLF